MDKYRLSTLRYTYTDEFYKYQRMIPWLQSMRIYTEVKIGNIRRPPYLENLSNIEYTWFLVMWCFKGTRFRVRNKSQAWMYRNLRKWISYSGIKHIRDIRTFCYSQQGMDYIFYTTSSRFFGPKIHYIVCNNTLPDVIKLARYITLVTNYPVIKKVINGGKAGYLHSYLYRKHVKDAGDVIDHINGRRFVARLTNLRSSTFKQNSENKSDKTKQDFFVGIFRVGNKWGNKADDLHFCNALSAARHYDQIIIKTKPFARTNKSLGFY